MTPKFDRAGLVEIGGIVLDSPNRQTAKLVVQFDVGLEDHYPRVEISLTIGKSLDVTLEDMNEDARSSAIVLLKSAVEVLENHALHELEQISLHQDAELDASLLASLDQSLKSIEVQ